MLRWLNPVALVGLVAVAGPILVHLLRRQRAPRMPFASLRFVRAASTAAVRLRLPSDAWLLVLRTAVIAAAAVALAQPIVVTPARRSAWDERISRAIVVDTSASMTTLAQRASEAAAAEETGVASAVRIPVDRLRDGILQASDALANAVPSRREIVVISDFRLGSLSASEAALVAPGVGLRFVTLGDPGAPHEFDGSMIAGAPGIEAQLPRVRVTSEGTSVRFTPARATDAGLRLIDAGDRGSLLLRAVARAGAPAPAATEPLALMFAGGAGASPGAGKAPAAPWMLRTIVRMRRDPALVQAARDHRRQGLPAAGGPAAVVARDAQGRPVVTAHADGRELRLVVAAGPADYLSAATLRSALTARHDEPGWPEQEIQVIPPAQLAAWAREPAPADPSAWRGAAPGDARSVWIVALALLGGEAFVRRRRTAAVQEVHADAA
jgi:hypothetical protein